MDAAMTPRPLYPIHASMVARLHPQYIAFYNKNLIDLPQTHLQPIETSRTGGKVIAGGSDVVPVGKTQDLLVKRKETSGPDVSIRCFTPPGQAPSEGWPVLLYSHGGGWVLGDIDTENSACTRMCMRANCVVITTDYRLAPEDPYPAAVHDVWEVLLWTAREGAEALNLNLHRYAVGGSSAGANLAAVVAQKLPGRKDLRPKITVKLQLLTVPITDNTATVDTNPTWRDCEHTPALPAFKMMWYRRHYLPNERTWSDVEASPLLLPAEQFSDLPPAQILVGEVDVLRHEGEEYGRKLRQAGVAADVEVMKGMPHPFMAMDRALDEGRRAINIMCDSLDKALHS